MTARAPYQKVYNRRFEILDLQVRDLEYVYSEKLADQSRVVLETNDHSYVDNEFIQEDNSIFLEWGYLGYPESRTIRKVYIVESEADFTETGLVLTLKCMPKGYYLKESSRQDVMQDASLESVATSAAENLGLTLVRDFTDDEGNENRVVSVGYSHDDIIKIGTTKSQTVTVRIPEYLTDADGKPILDAAGNKQQTGWAGSETKEVAGGRTFIQDQAIAQDNARVRLDFNFKRYPELPQANTSDAALINKLVDLEPTDNLVVTARDDELILKKRNFNQAPVAVFKWNLEERNVLSFKAGVKNVFKRKSTVAVSTDGWDPKTKEFFSTEVTATQEGSSTLAENVPKSHAEIMQAESDAEDEGRPNNIGYFGDYEEYETADGNGNVSKGLRLAAATSTNNQFVYYKRSGAVPGYIEANQGFANASDVTSRIEVEGWIPVDSKDHEPSIEGTPDEIAGTAINKRSQNNVNNATLKIEGDNRIIEGKMVNVQGLGRKYSGNWYIIKATHTCDTGGWLVTAELSRNAMGETDRFTANYEAAQDNNRPVNTKTEVEDPDNVTVESKDDQ